MQYTILQYKVAHNIILLLRRVGYIGIVFLG
jgi:hypothetical protein